MPSLIAALKRSRGTLAAILALAVAQGAAATSPLPATAAGISAETAEASLLAWANRDRAALGLLPLRSDPALVAVAGTRAVSLAASASFSHAAAGGDMAPALAGAGVQWFAWGENIARWPGGLQSETIAAIYQGWRESTSHWALLTSRTMNYVGFGVAVRATDENALASAVFTQSRDHTAPCAKIDGVTRAGTTITFAWHGYDPPLQSRWAGVRGYDAWYRVDGGSWRLVRDTSTATSLRLGSRARGHHHSLMVRARDRAGNVSRPSAPVSVWVP